MALAAFAAAILIRHAADAHDTRGQWCRMRGMDVIHAWTVTYCVDRASRQMFAP
jgi:hypothetical protein